MRIAIISESGTLPLTRTFSGNISQAIHIAGLLNHWVLKQSPDLVVATVVEGIEMHQSHESSKLS